MRIFIAAGSDDYASQNIFNNLTNLHEFHTTGKIFEDRDLLKLKGEEIYLTQTKILIDEQSKKYQNMIDKIIGDVDLIIMAAWHKGNSPPLLAVHTGGNPTAKNEPVILGVSPASQMKIAMKKLEEVNINLHLNRLVCMEATHGPPIFFKTPYMALEIGSNEKEWKDPNAGKAIAQAIMECTKTVDFPQVIVIGGSHYSESVRKIGLSSNYAVSHFFPSYSLKTVTKNVLKQAVEKSIGRVTYVVINKKEKSGIKKQFKDWTFDLGIEHASFKELY